MDEGKGAAEIKNMSIVLWKCEAWNGEISKKLIQLCRRGESEKYMSNLITFTRLSPFETMDDEKQNR